MENSKATKIIAALVSVIILIAAALIFGAVLRSGIEDPLPEEIPAPMETAASSSTVTTLNLIPVTVIPPTTAEPTEAPVIVTTAAPEFILPDSDSYTDQDFGTKYSGTLSDTYSYDVDQDGSTEKIGKYWCGELSDYFYTVYKGDKKVYNTYVEGGRGGGTGYFCLIYDGNTGSSSIALIYYESGMMLYKYSLSGSSTLTAVYPNTPLPVAPDSTAAGFGTISLNGKDTDARTVLEYLENVSVLDPDERVLSAALRFEISENGTETVTTETPTGGGAGRPEPSTETETTASAGNVQNRIAELNDYYSNMIQIKQDAIVSYKSSSDYDPAYVGLSPDPYYDEYSANTSRAALAERSGELLTAETCRQQADEALNTARKIETANSIQSSIDSLYDEIESLRAEWDLEVSLLQ